MLIDKADTFVWPAHFACTIVNKQLILPNHYNIKLFIEPNLGQSDNFNIGFQKIKHVLYEQLTDSVFINEHHPRIELFNEFENNIVHLPSDPYDFYICAVLLAKFITITEKYFNIYQLSLDSAVGDRIQYTISNPEESGLDLSGNYWWNQDTSNTGSKNTVTWEELNLTEKPKFQPTIVKGGKSEG